MNKQDKVRNPFIKPDLMTSAKRRNLQMRTSLDYYQCVHSKRAVPGGGTARNRRGRHWPSHQLAACREILRARGRRIGLRLIRAN